MTSIQAALTTAAEATPAAPAPAASSGASSIQAALAAVPAAAASAAPAATTTATTAAANQKTEDIKIAAVTSALSSASLTPSVTPPPAASTPGADSKEGEEVAISLVEGLHPKDAEAQVEKSANASIYQSVKDFKELPLSPQLIEGVYAMKFTKPSKIQAESLPIVLSNNRPNLIGQAHHGSGKTASYSLAMLSRVDENKQTCQAICVVPVRELAIQVFDVLSTLGKFTKIKIRKAIPEEPQGKVTEHIVVGTPGTLIAKIKHNEIDAKGVIMFVADEADQMISRQGLGDQTLQIKAKCTNKALQILLFSATFPTAVRKFAEVVAPKAISIHVKREDLSLDAIKQFFVDTKSEDNKYAVLTTLYGLLQIGQAIVFVQTVKTAKELTNKLRQGGFQVSLLHGKDMTAKDRDAVMKDFRTGKTTVLITTNVLARGIDVLSVTLVVNYDVPIARNGKPDPETYIHRIGRSGRFGRPGVAINFVHDRTSMSQLAEIATFFGCPITSLDVNDLEGTEKKVKDALQGPTKPAVKA